MAGGPDGSAARGATVTPNGTATRLLEAALRTLARQGTDNFSMANIGREAGVSRRTLYRYFHNSDEVLQAVAVHVGDSYVRAVDDAIAKEPALDKRVEVLLDVTAHYGDYHPAAVAVFRMEPAFTLQFLENTLDRYIEVVREALEPAHGEIPALAAGTVEPQVFAEILIRLGISGFTMHSAGVESIASAFAHIAQARTT